MTGLYKNIKRALEEKIITKDEALFLIYTFNEEEYSISSKSLLKLVKLGYVRNNKVSKKLLIDKDPDSASLKNTINFKFINDISKEIPKKLCKMFCVTDENKNIIFTGGSSETLKHTATEYLQGEELLAYYYIIFVFLFPIEGRTNRKWESHFTDFTYKGPRLRYRSKISGRLFKKMAQKYDVGVFLYATYLYIRSTIRENAVYCTSIKGFFQIFDDWYLEAEQKIKKADSVDELFKFRSNNNSRMNVML